MKKLLISLLVMVAPLVYAANPTFITFSNQYFTVSMLSNSIILSGTFPSNSVFLGNLEIKGNVGIDGTVTNITANFISGTFTGTISNRLAIGGVTRTIQLYNTNGLIYLQTGTNFGTIDLGTNQTAHINPDGTISSTNFTGTFSGTSAGIALSSTNSSNSYLTSGGFQTVGAFGLLTVDGTFTNSQVSWLSNATSHLFLRMGSTNGFGTNFLSRTMLVNSNDSVVFTNIVGTAALVQSFFQSIR